MKKIYAKPEIEMIAQMTTMSMIAASGGFKDEEESDFANRRRRNSAW